MCQSIQFKRTSLLLIPLLLACFALLPRAQAVTPELLPAPVPDGAYAGFNTAEGFNALLSLTNGTFNTAVGFAALKADTTGSHNTAVGSQALLNNNGDFNTAIGENALVHNTAGSFNMALGQGALASNDTGDGNTAMGFQALNRNTTGNDNVANGVFALFSNTTGSENTATGLSALFSNTTGSENTANGVGALGSNTTGFLNTANGRAALFNNTTGSENTADGQGALGENTRGFRNTANGFAALEFNTTGSYNTAVGWQALEKNNGTNNVALGVNAGFNLTSGNNNIDIANPGVAGESGTVRIGSVQARTFIAGVRGRTTGNANAVPVLIDSAGQLGTASSSRRFKKEIKPMDKISDAILALKPVTFHYKSDSTGTPQFGLIAEEVAAVNPDLVVRDENGEIYTVRYDAVNALLLNEFLKEHRKVQQLEKQVEKLTAGLEKVNAQLEASRPPPQMVATD